MLVLSRGRSKGFRVLRVFKVFRILGVQGLGMREFPEIGRVLLRGPRKVLYWDPYYGRHYYVDT